MFERIGLPEEDRATVQFLIGAHLEMSAAMSSRDIYDPAVAHEMAKRIGTVERLKYLTLLTYADISAVNPEAMTQWRSTLLWNLYMATYRRAHQRTRYRAARSPVLWLAGARGFSRRPSGALSAHALGRRHRDAVAMAREDAAVRIDKDAGSLPADGGRVGPAVPVCFHRRGAGEFRHEHRQSGSFRQPARRPSSTHFISRPLRTLELNPGEDEALVRTVLKTIRGELRCRDTVEAASGENAAQPAHGNSACARPSTTRRRIIPPCLRLPRRIARDCSIASRPQSPPRAAILKWF